MRNPTYLLREENKTKVNKREWTGTLGGNYPRKRQIQRTVAAKVRAERLWQQVCTRKKTEERDELCYQKEWRREERKIVHSREIQYKKEFEYRMRIRCPESEWRQYVKSTRLCTHGWTKSALVALLDNWRPSEDNKEPVTEKYWCESRRAFETGPIVKQGTVCIMCSAFTGRTVGWTR